MNQYQKLRDRQQQEFNSLPLGFAFSDKQFREVMQAWGLDPEKDTDKIFSIGYGRSPRVQTVDAPGLLFRWADHARRFAESPCRLFPGHAKAAGLR